jgi:hypothetical protein
VHKLSEGARASSKEDSKWKELCQGQSTCLHVSRHELSLNVLGTNNYSQLSHRLLRVDNNASDNQHIAV